MFIGRIIVAPEKSVTLQFKKKKKKIQNACAYPPVLSGHAVGGFFSGNRCWQLLSVYRRADFIELQ